MRIPLASAFVCMLGLVMQLHADEAAVKIYLHGGGVRIERTSEVKSISFSRTQMKLNGIGEMVDLDAVHFLAFPYEEILDIERVSMPEGDRNLESYIEFTQTGSAILAGFTIADPQTIKATLFSADGKTLGTPFVERLGQGEHKLEFALDKSGKRPLGAGVYILSLAGRDVQGRCRFVVGK